MPRFLWGYDQAMESGDMTSITIAIDPDIDQELERIARTSGHGKPEIARDILVGWHEDQADIRHASEVVARNEPASSSSNVRRRLGLER